MATVPTVIDLCCGTGAWSRAFMRLGFRAIGFDIRRWRGHSYPGELILQDVRDIDGRKLSGCTCIVASPPCTEFSYARPPWPQDLQPRSLEVVHACIQIACDARAPLVLENVLGLRRWLGAPRHHYGKFYLWGDGVPALLPEGPRWKDKQKQVHRSPLLRAKIPDELASAISHYHLSGRSSREC